MVARNHAVREDAFDSLDHIVSPLHAVTVVQVNEQEIIGEAGSELFPFLRVHQVPIASLQSLDGELVFEFLHALFQCFLCHGRTFLPGGSRPVSHFSGSPPLKSSVSYSQLFLTALAPGRTEERKLVNQLPRRFRRPTRAQRVPLHNWQVPTPRR